MRTVQGRTLAAIFLIGLALRIGYAIVIYEPSLVIYHGGDYALYRVGAEEILRGDLAFTNNLYLLRPPLFPLLIALLRLQPATILAVNILLSSLVIPLAFILARKLQMPERLALLAALIVALDPTSIKYAGVLVAEPLANCFLACAFVSAMALKNVETPKRIAALGLITGGLIALSSLARPASYLLWIPLAIWIAWARQRWRLVAASTLVLAGLLGTGLWISHNAVTYGHWTFSTIGNYNLLYYRAASVLYQATGNDIDDVYAELARRVEARLGNDTEHISARKRHEHYTRSPELQSAMTEVAIGVFRDHSLHYLLTIPPGLYRMLIPVSGLLLAPGLVWNLALAAGAAYGLWRLACEKRWDTLMFLALPTAYFLVGTILVQTSGIDTRARVMVTPLLAIMAAHGIMRMLNRRRAASASPSPPAGS